MSEASRSSLAAAVAAAAEAAIHGSIAPNADPGVNEDSIDSVKAAATINLLALAGLLFLFDLLLYVPCARNYLLPRFQHGDSLPGFPLGWLRQVWRQRSTEHLTESLPLDAAIFVRFLHLGFKFSVCGSILDIGRIPMYYTGSGGANGFNKFSVSNMGEEDPRFWGVVVSAYILTAVLLHLLLTEWRKFIALRRQHFLSACQGKYGSDLAQARRSILVENIPKDMRTSESVEAFFLELFGPDSVYSCVLQEDTTQLYRSVDLYKVTRCCECFRQMRPVTALEGVVDRVAVGADSLLRHDFHAEPMGHVETAARPSISHANAPERIVGLSTVKELGRGVRQLAVGVVQFGQDVVVGHKASSTAIVTFNKAADAAAAEQMLLEHGAHWKPVAAPEPRDLLWRNVPKPASQTRLRATVVQAWLTLGALFWNVPVVLVQTLSNVDSFHEQFPSLVDWLKEHYRLQAFVTAYLPAVAMIALQGVLPTLFELLATKYEGHKTKSGVQVRVLNRCFAYQLAGLYVTVLSGSVLHSLQKIIDRPSEVLNIMSESLPTVSVYFNTYVLAKVGTSLPLLLLRPLVPLMCATKEKQSCCFGSELANVALVLVLCLTYSFIAPAILPVCAVFFALAGLVYRWLFTHVYEPEFDSGGMMWLDLFRCVIIGLFMGTLSLVAIAYTTHKASHVQASVLVPLPFIVLYFGNYCWHHLGSQSKLVSLRDAVGLDKEHHAESYIPAIDVYTDPLLVEMGLTSGTARASAEQDLYASARESLIPEEGGSVREESTIIELPSRPTSTE